MIYSIKKLPKLSGFGRLQRDFEAGVYLSEEVSNQLTDVRRCGGDWAGGHQTVNLLMCDRGGAPFFEHLLFF
jgi:hypothetical protein